jgi:HD-GYP domain-containing protein (c-di-GMP phosphodiesterase class II)
LTTQRPCRAALPVAKAFGIMAGDAGTAIDPAGFEALRRAVLQLDRMPT